MAPHTSFDMAEGMMDEGELVVKMKRGKGEGVGVVVRVVVRVVRREGTKVHSHDSRSVF